MYKGVSSEEAVELRRWGVETNVWFINGVELATVNKIRVLTFRALALRPRNFPDVSFCLIRSVLKFQIVMSGKKR